MPKLTKLLLGTMALLLFLQADMPASGSILVYFGKLSKVEGKLYIAVYNQEKGFRDPDAAYLRKVEPITSGQPKVYFSNLPKGRYAVAVFQDLNGNGKLDTNLIGIPTEPYGFSNNPKIVFGPPSFSDSAVQVGEGQLEVQISLR